MRAFALDAFGAPSTGSIRDLPIPEPGDGQVRIRVDAAGVNPADVDAAAGRYQDFMPTSFPLVPGFDLAGIVDALGPGAARFAVGDRVFGQIGAWTVGAGTFAEYAIASTGAIARQPDGVDAAFAGSLPLPGVAAQLMVDAGAPRAGDVVVVVGATGGIGSVAVQLLVGIGARPIAVTRAENRAYARELGALDAIDYRTQDVTATVAAAHPAGIAGVFDLAGDADLNGRLAALIHRGGFLVSMARGANDETLRALGVAATNIQAQVTADQLERLAARVKDGTISRPEITAFRLEEAAVALERVAERHVRGKLVIAVSDVDMSTSAS